LIDYTPANNSRQDFGFANAMRVDFEDIVGDDDEIGKLSGFDRTFRLFTPSGVSSTKCIAANRLLNSQALFWNKTSLGFTFGGLPRDRSLNTLPRIQRHNRPIAAESEMPTGIRNTLPGPSARSSIPAGVTRPDVQRIHIRIGMQRLHAGDNAQLPEARDVRGGDRFNVLDTRATITCMIGVLSMLVSI
jgi:hypothetical protein